MRAAEAFFRLRKFGVPILSSGDAAAILELTPNVVNKVLTRLADAGLLTPIRRGLWSFSPTVDPLLLPEHVTAPWPSYVSLWSALHQHGVIEQIPGMTYAVSLGRTRRVRTPFASLSIHRIVPELFGGFEITAGDVKLAAVEKALFDLAYLSSTRDRSFSAAPELELPRRLDRGALRAWQGRITSERLRTVVASRLARLLGTGG